MLLILLLASAAATTSAECWCLPGQICQPVISGPAPGGGAGGGPSPTAVPTATPAAAPVAKQYWQWLGGEYSYGAGCADGHEIDPITTVLRHGRSGTDAHDTLINAGLPEEAGAEQAFRDNGGCDTGEISVADDGLIRLCGFPAFICGSDRWHARANVNSTADPAGGSWASATPHRDSSAGSPIDLCGHVIHSYIEIDGFSGSGFDVGRDWLWWQLVHAQRHYFEERQWWDNRLAQYQCNGEPTGANGYVNVIWMNH